jgi:hypothetical protein
MSETRKRAFRNAVSDKTASGTTIGKPRIELVPVNLTVNGQARTITVEPRMTLLDALREELALTGTKEELRSGRVRRMHRACQRPPRLVLYDAGGNAGRQASSAIR